MKRKYPRKTRAPKPLSPTEFWILLYERNDWKSLLDDQSESLGRLGVAEYKARAEAAKKAQEPSSVWWVGDGPLELSTMATYIITYLHGWWEFQPHACGTIAIVPGDPGLIDSLPVSPSAENIVWVTIDDPMFGIPFDEFRDSEGRPLQIVLGVKEPANGHKVETLDVSHKPPYQYEPYDPVGYARIEVSILD
ncbi:hypothetical protein OJ996_05500 [Luteolibacter sp. GHJ8]|uniref:Suppressor of fused protein SUFU n=1 Tax=Luteolibacter rhizosphaerae TaxID=2989719 RepID=A0ABT3FZJ5_9BACT|nr:hypothetical protein [Luteolibacter rhizosphaerae]MCW1913015.1 hypothetical protein [Luteolibacter rhizosphaerae]